MENSVESDRFQRMMGKTGWQVPEGRLTPKMTFAIRIWRVARGHCEYKGVILYQQVIPRHKEQGDIRGNSSLGTLTLIFNVFYIILMSPIW